MTQVKELALFIQSYFEVLAHQDISEVHLRTTHSCNYPG